MRVGNPGGQFGRVSRSAAGEWRRAVLQADVHRHRKSALVQRQERVAHTAAVRVAHDARRVAVAERRAARRRHPAQRDAGARALMSVAYRLKSD